MRALVSKIFVLLGLYAAVVLWCNCAAHPPTTPEGEEETPLSSLFLPDTLFLDTAFVPSRAAGGEVELRNVSGKPLTFSGFEGDCPKGITWTPGPLTIPDGASATMGFSFDPDQSYPPADCTLKPALTLDGQPVKEESKPTLTVEYKAGMGRCGLSPGHEIEFGSVEAGAQSDVTLTIANYTTDLGEDTRFEYQFEAESDQCSVFLLENPLDRIGEIEPGNGKDIRFSFRPKAEKTFECVMALNTVQRGALLPEPCPSPVTFRGAGLQGPEAECGLEPGAEIQFGEVEVGASKNLTLTIVNETQTDIPANQFKYLLNNPVGDCGLFTIDPDDLDEVIGPAERKDVVVHFAPEDEGGVQCTRTLSSLKEPADPTDPFITSACPTEIVWTGTGVRPPLEWSVCRRISGGNDLYGIHGLAGSEVYAVGDGGDVLRSSGECTWATSGPVFADVNLRDVWGSTNGTDRAFWAVGNIPPQPGLFGETGAILNNDAGAWAKVDEDGLHTYSTVWGSGLDDVFLAGTGVATDFPNAKHWDGSTLSKLKISEMGMSNVSGVSGTGPDDVWAVLEQGSNSVFRYHEGQWEDQTQAFMTQPLHDVWAIQGPDFYAVYAVGENGAIYHYDGATLTWTDESVAGWGEDLFGVWVSDAGQVFVVGEERIIYRGNAKGPPSWTRHLDAIRLRLPPGPLLDVWGAAGDDVYAVGSHGVIIRYGPSG